MSDDSTALLLRMRSGDSDAARELLPRVYQELHALAEAQFMRQRAGHTLQPTDLVHEAYLRLIRAPDPSWNSREHFVAVAATAMRHILVDHARRRRSQKRGGDWARVTLTGLGSGAELGGDAGAAAADRSLSEVLTIDAALARLEALHARHARVVEMRVFGGLALPEIAKVLGVSLRTIEGDWRLAKAWLAREMELGA